MKKWICIATEEPSYNPVIYLRLMAITQVNGDFEFVHRDLRSDLDLTISEIPFYSAVIFSRSSTPAALTLAKKASEQKVSIFYDIDDFIWKLPAYLGGSEGSPIINEIMSLASVITTPSEKLSDHIQKQWPNKKVVLIANPSEPVQPLDSRRTIKLLMAHSDTFRLPQQKRMIFESLEKAARATQCKLLIYYFGADLPDVKTDTPDLQIIFMGFRQYPHFRFLLEELKPTFGLVLLPEDHFSQYKSAIKFAELAHHKVIGLFSPVEPYISVVENQKTGFLLPKDLNNWTDFFESVFSLSKEQLNEFQTRAQNAAQSLFPRQKFIEIWKKELEGLAHRPISSQPPSFPRRDHADPWEAYLPLQWKLEQLQYGPPTLFRKIRSKLKSLLRGSR